MTHGPQIRAALRGDGQYDFRPSFSLVKPLIAEADLAVGNLETTFGGKPYSGYPMFSSPEAFGEALRDAGFDVLTTEPPREGNPLLARLPNLIVTPHTAWASEEALNTMTRMIEDNIRAFVSGAPTNVIVT